ncbi:hypothetical protein COLO4_38578 [Corchorus olitorius]|uniref:F-box domain-containing protein n=1 Tax=Corchorus olitorius TaxID=93759 RepID=A0A1R3FU58_9ROSI|nr:hypothetical protein COLO4_38578 [Corchorus olitorius]
MVRRRRNSSDEEMIPTRRVRKRCSKKKQESEEDRDRISNLTDELIHKIMSFMNTKYAVQTCVLSERWECLWKSLPYLDFNHATFPFKGIPWKDQDPRDKDPKAIPSFISFITQVLCRRHHTNLVEVCAQSLSEKPYAFILQGLITYALDHNVKQLSILSDHGSDSVLPESFYTCRSLEVLYLNRHVIKSPKFLALPALKSLHIHDIRMRKLESIFNLNLSGCPNLESLKLTESCDWERKTLFVNAPKLKSLEISFDRYRMETNDVNYGCKVVIDTPGLITLKYSGYGPIECSSDDHASVDNAFFDIYNSYKSGYDDMYREHVLLLINAFKAICHAKYLTLSLDTVEVLAMFPSLLDDSQSPFANLKYLKIKPSGLLRSEKVQIPAWWIIQSDVVLTRRQNFAGHRSRWIVPQ